MENYVKNLILPHLNLTYSEYYAYLYTIKASVWAVILTIISVVCRLIFKKFQKKVRIKENRLLSSNLNIFDESIEDIPFKELTKYYQRKNSSQHILIQLAILLSSIGCFLAALVYGIIPSILSSLGTISIYESMFYMMIISMVTAYSMIKIACPSDIKRVIKNHLKNESNAFFQKLFLQFYFLYRMHPFAVKSFAMILTLYPLVTPFVTSGSCMAYYTPADYGSSFDAFCLTTSFSRFFTMPKACPNGEICHIYTTLANNPSNSVILNVHTGSDVDSLNVLYYIEDSDPEDFETYATNQTFKSYYLDIEYKARRYVHSVYLEGLEPKTSYYAQVYSKGQLLGDARFTTFPSEKMEGSITMISGGDAGGTEKADEFVRKISQYDPDVVVIGGDVVYDNGNINCYSCWEHFLNNFKALNKKSGRLVPLILGVGNHDVGLNGLQLKHIDRSKNLLYLYFPQYVDFKNHKYEIPDPQDRRSYFYHKLGHTIHVSLDSGYLVRYSGEQANWLRDISSRYAHLPKLANYHVPIFPGCYFNPQKYGVDSRIHSWVPTFEKYKYMGVFENHMHLFKRTFPLKFSKEHNPGPGVTYFGDGAMGVPGNSCYDDDPERNTTGIFEKLGKVNHVWVIKITREEINYSAINLEGNVIDDYTQKISDYVSANKFHHTSNEGIIFSI